MPKIIFSIWNAYILQGLVVFILVFSFSKGSFNPDCPSFRFCLKHFDKRELFIVLSCVRLCVITDAKRILISNTFARNTRLKLTKIQTNEVDVRRRCSVKEVFLEISPNSQENTGVRDSFLKTLQAYENSKNTFFYRNVSVGCFWNKGKATSRSWTFTTWKSFSFFIHVMIRKL